MPIIYILKFIKDWGNFKSGKYKITTSKATRDALVETYKVAVEIIADECQKPLPGYPPKGEAGLGQPTPEKSPILPDPQAITDNHVSEIIRPRHRRGR